MLESFLAKSGDKLGITEINALVSELAQQRKVLQLVRNFTVYCHAVNILGQGGRWD